MRHESRPDGNCRRGTARAQPRVSPRSRRALQHDSLLFGTCLARRAGTGGHGADLASGATNSKRKPSNRRATGIAPSRSTRRFSSKNPSLAGIHYRIGRIFLSKSPADAEAAKAEFNEEVKIDPDNASAEFMLGEIARQAGQWDDAIAHFSRASKLDERISGGVSRAGHVAQFGREVLGRDLAAAQLRENAARRIRPDTISLPPPTRVPARSRKRSGKWRCSGRRRRRVRRHPSDTIRGSVNGEMPKRRVESSLPPSLPSDSKLRGFEPTWQELRVCSALLPFPAPSIPHLLSKKFLPAASGISWVHVNGRSPMAHLPETVGAGCAFVDYDNDGWMDIYLVNSGPCDFYQPPQPLRKRALPQQS